MKLKIFHLIGIEVGTLMDRKQNPGNYEVEWNAAEHAGGFYFYQLFAGDYVETKKMIILK